MRKRDAAEKKRKWMYKILQITWKIRDGILKMSEDLQGREAGDDTSGQRQNWRRMKRGRASFPVILQHTSNLTPFRI